MQTPNSVIIKPNDASDTEKKNLFKRKASLVSLNHCSLIGIFDIICSSSEFKMELSCNRRNCFGL